MQILSTKIQLDDLRFYAFHGVLPQETVVGGDYRVSLTLTLNTMQAALEHDCLEGTLDYSKVYALVAEQMQQPSALLEHVAGRILTALFDRFPQVQGAEVKVTKVNPPMGADCRGASVLLEARR